MTEIWQQAKTKWQRKEVAWGNFVFQGYTVKAKQATFENYGLTVVEGGSQWGDGLYGWRFQLKRMNFGFVRHAFITNDGIENVKITYFIIF